MKKKWLFLFTTILVVTLVCVITITIIASRDTRDLREVKSYIPGDKAICLAASEPECGNCPGKTIDDKCYVKEGTFPQYY